jgi:ankyrin repeat protein
LAQSSISKRRAALATIPEKLEAAFQAIITRIRDECPVGFNLGMEVLKWTYLVERQLSIQELRHAIAAAEFESDSIDSDDLPFQRSLIEGCHDLVIINQRTSSIRLVHKSLHDFLKAEHDKDQIFALGHQEIARTCLCYMSLKDDSMTGNLEDDYELFHSLSSPSDPPNGSSYSLVKNFPLLKYAIYVWGEDARKQADHHVSNFALTILLQNDNPQCISHHLLPLAIESCLEDIIEEDSRGEPNDAVGIPYSLVDFSGLHVAAHFCLDTIASNIICQLGDFDINSKNWGMTPLMVAAKQGHQAVVRLLLDQKDIDVESKGCWDRSALSLAPENGHEAVVRILLERGATEINSSDCDQLTTLDHALSQDHPNTVRLLIERGATFRWEQPADNVRVARFCLENGVKYDKKDCEGRSWLAVCALNGWNKVAQLLLDHGADIESTDKNGRTPLSRCWNSFALAHLLIEKGANIHSRDTHGRSVLSNIITKGEWSICIEDAGTRKKIARCSLARQ